MNRTSPSDVLRALRREVGFGCRVDGCGNPYLYWHHFDPPWRERERHNPAGSPDGCHDRCVGSQRHLGDAERGGQPQTAAK